MFIFFTHQFYSKHFNYCSVVILSKCIMTFLKVRMLRTYVRNMYQYHRQKIYEIIMHHYSDWEKPTDPKVVRDELMELLGDAQYVAPVMELTDYHARYNAKTFLYS